LAKALQNFSRGNLTYKSTFPIINVKQTQRSVKKTINTFAACYWYDFAQKDAFLVVFKVFHILFISYYPVRLIFVSEKLISRAALSETPEHQAGQGFQGSLILPGD
jgi:hypothetical protein